VSARKAPARRPAAKKPVAKPAAKPRAAGAKRGATPAPARLGAEPISARALGRATLARQMLLARERVAPAKAIERLAGLQAQQARPPFVGLWTRLEGFQREHLARAIADRSVVRATAMRGTLHLLSARDYLRLRAPLQPGLTAGLRALLRQRMDGLDIPAAMREGRAFFGEAPRPFDDFRERLEARFPRGDVRALAYAVRLHLPLVQVPDDSEWGFPAAASFALADRWLGRPIAASEDPSELALRYLAAFGPASAADAQSWSGVPALAEVFDRLRGKLRAYRDEKRRELFDLPEAPRPDENALAPVRFVPEFDNLVLAWTDRSRIMTDAQRKVVVTRNLQVLATVLVDGVVAATWTIEREKGAATLQVTPFAPLAGTVRDALEAEGEKLLAFAAPDAARRELRIAPRRG